MKRDSTADSIVRFCAVMLPGLVVVFFLPAASVTVAQAKTILLALIVPVAAFAWGVAHYRDKTVRLSAGPILLAALLLPITYMLSALIHGAPAASFAGGMGEQDTVATMTLLFGCLLLCSVAFEDSALAVVAYMRSLVLGGLVLMAMQMFHLIFPGLTLGVLTGTATSVFGSWHELGIISGLFVFLVCTLWQSSVAEGWWKWILLALGLCSGLMLFVVNMSDVWYVFGALIILFGLYQWRTLVPAGRGRGNPASRVIAMLVIGLVALVSGYGGAFMYRQLPGPLQVLNAEVRPSWKATFTTGKGVFGGVVPVLAGSGPNTFTRDWSLYKPAGVNKTNYWNIDFSAGVGLIPTTFITAGLLGVMAWLLLCLALVIACIGFFRERLRSPEYAVTAAVFASVFYLILFHLLYAPGIGLSVLMFALLGVLATGDVRGASRAVPLRLYDKSGIARAVIIMVVPVALVLSSVFTVRAVVSDILVNASAVVYGKTHDTQNALSLIDGALTVNAHNARAERAAVQLGLLELSRLSASDTAATAVELQRSVQTSIGHGLAAVAIDGDDYRNWLVLASLYQNLTGAGVQGAYMNAVTAYEHAHKDNPNNPLPLVLLAQLEIPRKNYTHALALLAEADALKSGLPATLALRSRIEVVQNNIQAALADATAVAQATPDDPQGWYSLGTIFYRIGMYQNAAAALEKSVALQPEYANALLMLSLSYDSLGRTAEALDALVRVQQLNPSDTTLPEMIQNIRAGKPALSSVTSPVTDTQTPAKQKGL